MIVCVFGKRGKGKTHYLKNVVRGSLLPCVIVDTLNEYQGYAVHTKITDAIRFDLFKVRFVPDTELDFDIACRCVVNERWRFGLNFIIDEIDFFTSSHKLPLYFERCLKYSRHFKINMYLSVRNPSELNRKISALADKFVIFNLTEPIYLDYFEKYRKGISDAIRRIPKYKHITLTL